MREGTIYIERTGSQKMSYPVSTTVKIQGMEEVYLDIIPYVDFDVMTELLPDSYMILITEDGKAIVTDNLEPIFLKLNDYKGEMIVTWK
jgi:hypothetical protein